MKKKKFSGPTPFFKHCQSSQTRHLTHPVSCYPTSLVLYPRSVQYVIKICSNLLNDLHLNFFTPGVWTPLTVIQWRFLHDAAEASPETLTICVPVYTYLSLKVIWCVSARLCPAHGFFSVCELATGHFPGSLRSARLWRNEGPPLETFPSIKTPCEQTHERAKLH